MYLGDRLHMDLWFLDIIIECDSNGTGTDKRFIIDCVLAIFVDLLAMWTLSLMLSETLLKDRFPELCQMLLNDYHMTMHVLLIRVILPEHISEQIPVELFLLYISIIIE